MKKKNLTHIVPKKTLESRYKTEPPYHGYSGCHGFCSYINLYGLEIIVLLGLEFCLALNR